MRFDAILSTSADQSAVTSGQLVSEWEAPGRRYFHYAADGPMRNFYGILSARYRVKRSTWNEVALEIHNHPRARIQPGSHDGTLRSRAQRCETLGFEDWYWA